jgi:hypothetical protein
MRQGWAWIAFGLLGAVAARADQLNFGTGGSDTWTLAAGTRARVLGSTAGLLADDATVLAQNPAALSLLGEGEMDVHHGSWDAGVSWDQAAAVVPVGPRDALGISGALASYDSFQRTDELGNITGSYEASEALSGAGYSHRFGDLALGASGFLTRQSIDKDVLYGYAWASGAVWQPLSSLSLDAGLRSATEGLASPDLEGDFGAAIHSSGDRGQAWSLAFDSDYSSESTTDMQLAVTRGFRAGDFDGQVLGGYRVDFASGLQKDTYGNWALGATLGWQSWAVDYAYVPMGDVDTSHHFGLRYRFNSSSAQAATTPPLAPRPITPLPLPIALPTPWPTPAALPGTRVLVLSDGVVKGQSLEAQGQARAALEAYAAAAVADPQDLPAWRCMAKLYDRLNRPDLGVRCWREVARIDPADLQAADAIRLYDAPRAPTP